jgi:hypothetical protein
MLASLLSVLVIDSCKDEEKPAVVTIAFTSEFQTITEGEEASISIVLDHPSPVNANVRIAIETDAVYGQNYETDPVIKEEGETQLLVKEGHDTIEVKLKSLDDSKFTDSRFVVLRITSSTASFKLGNPTTHTLTIHDDEGPSIPYFQSELSELEETNADGQKIEIRLSSPAEGEGSLTLRLDPRRAVPGTHFTMDRELKDNKFTLNAVEGDAAVSFKVFPVNNDVYTGDFVLKFELLETSGVVRKADSVKHALTLKDDEVPSFAEFAAESGTIDEPGTTPHVINLVLSPPVQGEGTLKIRIGNGATYGVDFVTTPEAEGGVVFLDISRGQTEASFSVTVIDDDVVGGDLTIPFSIEPGTAPIFAGAKNQKYVLTVVDNERPTLVEFTSSTVGVEEASTTGIDVEIELSAPAPGPGEIVLEVLNNRDQVSTNPPIEKIYSSFSDYVYQITLDVPEGAESVSFHVDPINNSYCGRNRPVTFSLISVPNSLEVGSNDKLTLTLLEDEPHIGLTLVETEGELMENATKGIKVELKASDPMPAPPTVMVYLELYTHFPWRFKTVPDFLETTSFSVGYTFGYMEYEIGATSLSFEIVPVNDTEDNGNFTELIYFEVNNDIGGSCVILESGPYTLNFVDDD